MSKLKEARAAKGITQKQLAVASSVSLGSLQKYESGERDINKAEALTVYKIAQALSTTVEKLLNL